METKLGTLVLTGCCSLYDKKKLGLKKILSVICYQVSIGTIVRGGPADLSGQLQRGDEIHHVDGISVIGATHRRVISLMGNAALTGHVTLGIHRDPAKTASKSRD